MTAADVLDALRTRGVGVWREGERLRFRAPEGVDPSAVADLLRTHRVALLAWLTYRETTIRYERLGAEVDVLTDAARAAAQRGDQAEARRLLAQQQALVSGAYTDARSVMQTAYEALPPALRDRVDAEADPPLEDALAAMPGSVVTPDGPEDAAPDLPRCRACGMRRLWLEREQRAGVCCVCTNRAAEARKAA